MGYLTKAQIDAADDRKTVDFEVPEWGGTVRLMVMSGKDLDKFEQLLANPESQKDGGVRAQLVGKCLVGENGKPLYSDAEIFALGKKNGAVLTRIFRQCVEINKIDKAEEDEAVKDFDDTPAEDSTTD